MKNGLFFKNIILGFLSWLLPFALSFLFYKPGGVLVVPYATFKSVIILIGSLCGSFLLFHYFKSVNKNFISNGVFVGFSWFAINIFLDVLFLLPMMKTSFEDYFMSIGASYLVIPVMSITFGYLLQSHKQS
jgi:hypothetical protein